MTPTLETQARELVEKIRKATLVLVPEQVQPPIIKWATSDPVALLLDALSAAHAEGARQALREAAQRMDTSDHDPWARVEIRDWLLWQAGQDGG